MQIRMEMGMQTQLEQLQLIHENIEELEVPKRSFILIQLNNVVRRSVDRVLANSTLSRAKMLQNAGDERREFDRLMVQKAIHMYSKQITDTMRANLKVNQQVKRIAHISDSFPDVVQAFLEGRHVHIQSSDIDHEMERLLTKLFEKDKADHFATLRQKQKAIVRPLTEQDIDAVGRLYGQFQFTGEGVLNVALGHDTQETFLNDFEAPGAEGPTMREMLVKSAKAARRDTIEQRREEETMEGWVVTSDQEPYDIWAVCIYVRSPLKPRGNERFIEKNRRFLEEGVSGGQMQYPTHTHRRDFEKSILDHPSMKLFLVAGKEPGAVEAAHEATLRGMKDVVKDESAFTYTMGGLTVHKDDELIEGERDSGQNARCVTWLTKAGYKHTGVSDEFPNGPMKEFIVTADDESTILSARPHWIHFKAKYKKLKDKALGLTTS